MEISTWQKKVDEWIRSYGQRYFDPLTNTALLAEETGEVARLMARIYGEQSFKGQIDEKNSQALLSDEIADLLFVIACIANQCEIDLENAINRNMEKKTSRDSRRHRDNEKLR